MCRQMELSAPLTHQQPGNSAREELQMQLYELNRKYRKLSAYRAPTLLPLQLLKYPAGITHSCS